MRPVAAVLLLLLTACAGASAEPEAPDTAAGFPVTIDHTGGCMMMGPNCVRYVAEEDGTVTAYRLGLQEPEILGTATIDQTLVADLSAAIAATDLDDLRSRLDQGQCMGCVDGIDTEVTFTVDDVPVSFSSIDVEFDPSEPVFAALVAIVNAAQDGIEVPLLAR